MANNKKEDVVLIETESEDFDFTEEGETTICVIQRLLCSQKNPDTT